MEFNGEFKSFEVVALPHLQSGVVQDPAPDPDAACFAMMTTHVNHDATACAVPTTLDVCAAEAVGKPGYDYIQDTLPQAM